MSAPPPAQRLPPSVYRRRRIVLLLVLIAIACLVWALIAQPWRGAAADQPAAKPTATKPAATQPVAAASSSPTPSAAPAPEQTTDAAPEPSATPESTATPVAKPCVSRDVTVEALSDQDTYEPGQNPQLSIRLTNDGATDCTLNVGTSGQSFTIKSGNDVWWRSTDCQTEPSDMVVLIAAGQSVTSAAPLTWDRTRSAVGTCADTDRQSAPGGGASYHLSVEIGGISSTQSKQMLLY